MSRPVEHAEVGGAADQLMRRVLNEVDGLRARVLRDADDIRKLRDDVRTALIEVEQRAREHVGAFVPRDLGESMRRDLQHAFGRELPRRRPPQPPPTTFDEARQEWNGLVAFAQDDVRGLIAARRAWDQKLVKRRKTMPTVGEALWTVTVRLSEIHAALPALRERYVTERLDAKADLNGELNVEIARRAQVMDEVFSASRRVLAEAERAAGLPGADWSDPGWRQAAPAGALQRMIRAGEIDPRLPASSGITRLPLLLSHPLTSGVAIASGVARRQEAIDLARSLALRSLAATPPGKLRFIFVDPVSLGQSVADFRHLAEYDTRLVDTKTWTTEREIETKVHELAAHLEVVISTYLRGQFDSIEDYNRQAGEVAEPYRVLVVLDYPTGFSAAAARQLLSLIENGTRCGVHVILQHDPERGSVGEVPLARLTHSMQRIDLTTTVGRVILPAPIGEVAADFVPDGLPRMTFTADGRAETPTAQLLLRVGAEARRAPSGPVTLRQVVPIVNRLVATDLSSQVPAVRPGAPDLDPADSATWWNATTATGACAPIGRSGAHDIAALYFSSTEIAGGAIVVGLPRTGKSTALHAAIVSLAMVYPPEELELYLVDSKHGVEFKVYEHLPHARLVSINSEREFSVNVLQSLDGEIRRRAELMKRETAGKANITEYRSTTGKAMPRIVLFMDEFHELFEEDDALGQAAFRAFSNIVRQGPFAGVHVVVSSQTLSSMPAMDRSTLALLPMRVAFMCNDADADLVMGDLNREVRALTQQGEGIFNPARGEPSHNKPFRGLYIPSDERGLLLTEIGQKAARAGITRVPRVFDGDRLAQRPSAWPQVSAGRPVLALGEPFDLDPYAGIALRRGRGSNVLLLGSAADDADADPAVAAALQSCVAGAKVNGMAVQVIDFIGDTEPAEGLDLLELCEALSVSYRRASGFLGELEATLGEVETRRRAEDYRRPGRLLVLNGIHRAFDLAPEDPYADPDDPPRPGTLLARVVRDGPEVGCHTAVLVDSLVQFERKAGRDLLSEFEWCVTGSDATVAEITTVTDVYNAPAVRSSQLLLADRAGGKQRRIRAYPRHTIKSLPRSDHRSST
ncbi:FtsK/SpoIIIE family protein [Solirubrobacter pauli]|uniref:FtsK/SpoIIIE family protein n=1 Tax=Solirubrobacter pauli TaxID=166793 RepID=A0A660LIJ8_9ACTN|nr:FtsK/SpoIIIE domain-containing protein [Solirubrobacter pauli]RKQ93823.1 FtsK/SpoIIIE family protein [Solirubrobacter pauli]